MEKTNLLAKLKNIPDGQKFNLILNGDVALSAQSKKAGHTAYKITVLPVVKGVDYTSRPKVQKAIKNGKVLSHTLPWGTWSTVPGEEKLIINHNSKSYLRAYLEDTPSTLYFLDNKNVTKDELHNSGLVNESYFNAKPDNDVLTLTIDKIIEVI